MNIRVRQITEYLLDLILPPKCLNCDALIDEAHNICTACWKNLYFISGNVCQCCGYPFDDSADLSLIGEELCGVCQGRERPFNKVRSVLRYDDHSRKMVIAYKHHDKMEYAVFFHKLLLQAGADILENSDLIIPVPLHKKRLSERRYNQSALLSKLLSKKIKKPNKTNILTRKRNTPPQEGNVKKRVRNVSGAFKVVPAKKKEIKGKNILLIDDVYTTGATIENCAKELKKAGAHEVYALTIFRVIAPQNIS